eukprot:7926101-Prorocentrum_lima.AAC.1
MTSSLVGSEMCIRDRKEAVRLGTSASTMCKAARCAMTPSYSAGESTKICLLYTSDAADDM